MARSQLQIKGVVSNPVYEEGSSYSLVNIRNKNGGLVPVPKRKIVRSFEHRFDIIYLHQVNDLERIIGVVYNDDKSNSTIYFEKDDGTFSKGSLVEDTITGVSQTGYILSFVGLKDIYYANFKNKVDAGYEFLGKFPNMQPIRFGGASYATKRQTYESAGLWSGINKDNFIERTKALIYTLREELNKDQKSFYFFDAFFIRYAYRLYDGTLIKHSQPILIMPPYEYRYCSSFSVCTSGNDTIEGYILGRAYACVMGYKILYLYDFRNMFKDYSEGWKDIIKSCDIFISKPLGFTNPEKMEKLKFPKEVGSTKERFVMHNQNVCSLKDSELRALTEDVANFYFIKSIPMGTDNWGEIPPEGGHIEIEPNDNNTFPDSSVDLQDIDNLIYQEEMSDNNMSNHSFGSNVVYDYNKRLHIANVRQNFFKGFDYEFFMNNTTEMASENNKLLSWSGDQDYLINLGYNGIQRPHTKESWLPNINTGGIIACFIETTLELGGVNGTLVSSISIDIDKLPVGKDMPFLSAFLSYPDTRAKKARILIQTADKRIFEIGQYDYKPHDFLNLSYFLNGYFKPIFNDKAKEVTDFDIESVDNVLAITDENKLKVSELNNPFYFANKNTYQVSNGKILNMATNAMRVSEGQFGQYPLYIFTTKGIYALNVGGAESVYSNIDIPVSFDVATNPNLCSTNNGVVFVSDRGLKFISGGQQVDLITQAIEPLVQNLNYRLAKSIEEDYLIIRNKRNFLDNLKHIDAIAFNSLENEIIVSLDDTYLNYVISLNTGMIWLSTEDFHTVVQNSYPYLLVLNNNDMIDYQLDARDDAEVNIQLLPCSFATTDFKRLERLIARGNIEVPSKLFLGVFSSLDNTNFNLCRGAIIKAGKYKDFDMGAITSNKARQYGLVLSGWLNKMSRLDFLDLEISKELDTDKQR